MTAIGEELARAIAAKDAAALRELLRPDVDFTAITPRRHWNAGTPDDVAEIVFGSWFEDKDRIDSVEHVETDAFADRERVGYRFAVTNPEGRFLVEQQAYLEVEDGRIGWMRLVCSGFRPVG